MPLDRRQLLDVEHQHARRYVLKFDDGFSVGALLRAHFTKIAVFQVDSQIWPEVLNSWVLVDEWGNVYPSVFGAKFKLERDPQT